MDTVGHETLETMEKSKQYNDWLFSLISPYVSGDILEIGSGIGNFTGKLMTLGSVWASDINSQYLKKLSNRFGGKIQIHSYNVELDGEFSRNKKFDSIICLNVLEHINNDSRALSHMFDRLKPEGRLVLLVPAHQRLYSIFDKSLGHFRRYTTLDLKSKLTKIGFNKVTIRYLNWFGAIGWFIYMKLGKSIRIPDSKLSIFDKLASILLFPERYIKLPFGLSVFAIAYKK